MSFGERFLVNPDLFPARRGGETWGERDVVLDLPGGPYRFSGLSGRQEDAVRRRFAAFCRPPGSGVEGEGAVESLVFRIAGSDFLELDLRGWEYGLDLDFQPGSIRLAGLRLAGRIDWRPGLTGALWTPEEEGDLFGGVLENFFRAIASYRIREQGGVILHSAGVVRGGGGRDDAFLFLGRSGAGKTTVSRLSLAHGAAVLSDDLNALRWAGRWTGEDGAEVQKLPFTGDLGDATAGPAYPLRAVFRLTKSTEDRLRRLSRAEAVACLLACAPFLNSDPHRREPLFSDLLALAAIVPAFELRFTLAGTFWTILAEKWPESTSIAC